MLCKTLCPSLGYSVVLVLSSLFTLLLACRAFQCFLVKVQLFPCEKEKTGNGLERFVSPGASTQPSRSPSAGRQHLSVLPDPAGH